MAARLMPNNPYDGHTLATTLAAANLRTLLRRFVFVLRYWLADPPKSFPIPYRPMLAAA